MKTIAGAVAVLFVLFGTTCAYATGLSVYWKPLTMSLDACVARAAQALRGQGLSVYKSGQDTDANGAFGYAWGENAQYDMVVECIQRQALVVFFITGPDDARLAIRNAVSAQF